MNSLPQSEMLAVLLNLVGGEAASSALSGIPEETSRQVKATLEEFKTHPPTQDEVEYVVDDFVKYFRFAMKTVDQKMAQDDSADSEEPEDETPAPKIMQLAEEDFEVEIEPEKKFLPLKETGNHIQDLTRLHPYQVAHAIRNEDALIISIVIRNLATEHAAKTLEFLPDTLRPAVFLQLAQPCTVSNEVLQRILETAVQIAKRVEKRENVVDAAEQMVTLIRSVPKHIRGPILDELQKTDEELSNKVKAQMYQFDDLSLLSDRDLQQVLGQTSTDSLASAVQGIDSDLMEKILGNMSKRARAAFEEELSFKGNVKQDEIDMGRAEVVRALTELDEAGTITLE
ncbi:FliG C-terminal domain-containing protein [Mariniblastus fucicola]|uniref:Flagellar motor switch protein FliG n=1 Tax=Mariniblastus fucicola TaxID=980251 RepID=A0A5B9PL13_9BACT|nr:FliG C-terminal domain-containing protein [Mariniblastus fucicola]QEG23371.1 Flagellar motor switch protein FliG [Mariniblastus fucicola]